MAPKRDVKILDCTVRDGGYLNNWDFNRDFVREAYRSISKSGVDIMEIGYRGTDAYFDRKEYGIWRFSDEDILKETVNGISGARISLMADFGKIDVADFPLSRNSVVDLVRVAAHKYDLKDAIELLEKIKEKGYDVSLNAMGYSNYTKKEQKAIASMLKKSAIDIIYVVDSYGSIFPGQIRHMLDPLLQIGKIKVGFHPHNSLQMAFANSLEAIRCGAHFIDSTLYGMGRGAGNLPTEILVLYMELSGNRKYNVIPLLNCIDAYLLPFKKEIEWGYQLPYMLSGMHKCHPNYANKLVSFREYAIEDVSNIMEIIGKQEGIGYSDALLKEVIEKGCFGKSEIPRSVNRQASARHGQEVVPYVGRHKERDFLILANGPTLKEYKEKIDKFIKKVDPVILGANNLSGLYTPHYHAFNNKKRFMMYAGHVSKKSRLLLSQYFSDDMIREYTGLKYESLYFKDILSHDFDIKEGIIQTNCRTISVLLIAVAIVMGARRIFVAGMDGYLDFAISGKSLYYEEKDEKTDREMIMERHKWCQFFLEQINGYCLKNNREGIHIITPTSYKAFYKGIENYINQK